MIHRVFDQAPHDPEVFYESLDDDVEWDARGVDLPDTDLSHGSGPAPVREFFGRWVARIRRMGH